MQSVCEHTIFNHTTDGMTAFQVTKNASTLTSYDMHSLVCDEYNLLLQCNDINVIASNLETMCNSMWL